MKFLLSAMSLVIFLLFTPTAKAEVMLFGERVKLKSEVLEEEREIQVLLPENYQSDLASTYPVVYLLDGDYNFHGISGMLDLLANKGQLIPKVILVGIADKGTGTYRQNMSPTGSAKQFLSFIKDELTPYINKHYRAAKNTTLVGHSIGGLFVLNAFMEEPELFEHYVAISPSVWMSDNAIIETAKQKLKSIDTNSSLYISLGDEVKMSIYAFIDQLDYKAKTKLNWQFKHYPDENHNSVSLIALRDALKDIFRGWYTTETILERNSPSETLAYFEQKLAEFKISQPMPALISHIMIRQHYRQKISDKLPAFVDDLVARLPASKQSFIAKQASFVGHYATQEDALALLLKHETEFSQSIDYQKAIAGTYKQMKNEQLAKTYYQKALELAKAQNVAQWQLNILQEYL